MGQSLYYNERRMHSFAGTIEIRIPNEPKFPLRNYLLELVSEFDEKESSIYMNGVEHFIQHIWNEVVKNNWRKLNVRKLIPERLGIRSGVFYGYKNGKKAVSILTLHKLLLLWQEFCNKSDGEVHKKWDEIYHSNFTLSTHSKCQRVLLPKFLFPKLSYLLGWICGDGYLKSSKNRYTIKISEKSIEQLELVLKPLFREIFDANPPIFKRSSRGYAIQIGSKPIFRFLTQVIRLKVGDTPTIVKNMDPINKKHFLAGILDSEGHIDDSYKGSRIIISQADQGFLKEIMILFKEVGVDFTGPHLHKGEKGIWYTIQIRKKSEIMKFARLVGSYHVNKLQRLHALVNVIEKNRHN